MNKKILTRIGILIVLIILISGCIRQPTAPTEEQLSEKFCEFESQYDEKKTEGYDVTEAEEFARKAKQAFDREDYETANKLLDKAFEALERPNIPEVTPTPAATPTPIPVAIVEEAKEKLSRVKVASLYESVSDSAVIEAVTDGTVTRDIDDVIRFVEETKTDFIFRGFWRWSPSPESPETATENEVLRGYTYEQLKEAISQMKGKMPDVIICGAIPAQKIEREERNPIAGETLDEDKTWEMALDPERWDLDMSKEEFQQEMGNILALDWTIAHYPDITNPIFQELLLSWAKKQIDCGVDAIWIDLMFTQANRLSSAAGNNPYHPAVEESYMAASKIVDDIHNYGLSKGKYIYVGTWAFPAATLPYPPPNLDFVTLSPSSKEIMDKKLDENKWNDDVNKIQKKFEDDILIVAFIDWTDDGAPLAVFSQRLSKEEQRDMLITMDDFFESEGIIFAYPVHGGWMGKSAKVQSFGKWKTYDSIAPEFETYETIKELAQNK